MYQYRGDKELIKWAKKKFSGNAYLFRLINVFSFEDLIQEYYEWRINKKGDNQDYLIGDFSQHITDLIRVAKNRLRKQSIYNFTDYDKHGWEGIEKTKNVKAWGRNENPILDSRGIKA